MHKQEENNKERNKEQGAANNEGSSSDTDKTSSSLFNATGGGIELSRIKELPVSFYNGYASLDEFLSAASTSDNQNQVQSKRKNEKIHTKRRHHQRPYGKSMQVKTSVAGQITDKNTFEINNTANNYDKNNKLVSTETGVSFSSNTKQQRHAQDAIDEMNRQYDHNLCLDRFINEMEFMQKNNQESESQEQQNENIPSNSSLSSYSSVAPQSNEDTDSGSRNSESIKSSTPENGKAEKVENDIARCKKSVREEKQGKPTNTQPKLKSKVIDGSLMYISPLSQKQSLLNTEKQLNEYTESGIEITSSSNNSGGFSTASIVDEIVDEKTKNYKGGKLGRKRKRGYIYNPKPVMKKPPKQFVHTDAKDQCYWEKRQRNNEAARKSREMRHEKVKEIHENLVLLKKENEALRVAITLLIQRNESLECIIDEYEKSGSSVSRSVAADGPPSKLLNN